MPIKLLDQYKYINIFRSFIRQFKITIKHCYLTKKKIKGVKQNKKNDKNKKKELEDHGHIEDTKSILIKRSFILAVVLLCSVSGYLTRQYSLFFLSLFVGLISFYYSYWVISFDLYLIYLLACIWLLVNFLNI